MQDHFTRRVYRLYDFSKSYEITSEHPLLRVGDRQQCTGQTVPGHRVGQEGCETQIRAAVTTGVERRGSESHELT